MLPSLDLLHWATPTASHALMFLDNFVRSLIATWKRACKRVVGRLHSDVDRDGTQGGETQDCKGHWVASGHLENILSVGPALLPGVLGMQSPLPSRNVSLYVSLCLKEMLLTSRGIMWF